MDTSGAYAQLTDRLTATLGAGEARSVARIVLEDAFHWRTGQRPRLLTAAEVAEYEALSKRLAAGEPVQYVLGEADFFGLKFRVTPAVLIPRPETEELVEWALDWLGQHPRANRVLDIGTGSGCIPVTLGQRRTGLRLTAIDNSAAAIAVAEQNAARHGVPITVRGLDFLDPVAREQLSEEVYDLIVSNPPYIPERERHLMSKTVLDHEPAAALFVDNADPLVFYRAILAWSAAHLSKAGAVLFECNEFNVTEVAQLARQHHWSTTVKPDLQGKPRMLLAAKELA
jgi:release factor glutamine methyltransferase